MSVPLFFLRWMGIDGFGGSRLFVGSLPVVRRHGEMTERPKVLAC